MGVFKHEAVAVDPPGRRIYLTEDESDGGFYRFTPARYPDLSQGLLEIAKARPDGKVDWIALPDPLAKSKPLRHQVPGSTKFKRGEGIWFDSGIVYFTTKGDNRVWAYNTAASTIEVIYDLAATPDGPLKGVDNVTVSSFGDIYVCEDGGNMEIALLTPEGDVVVFARLGVSSSEMTGVAFNPSGGRMYVSSQRNPGRTYEISGPFRTSSGGTTTTTSSTTTTSIGGLTLSASGYKVKGVQHADLRWSGATTADVVITRNGATIATTANDGFHTDNIGKKGSGSYTYKVCETNGGPCSNTVTVTF